MLFSRKFSIYTMFRIWSQNGRSDPKYDKNWISVSYNIFSFYLKLSGLRERKYLGHSCLFFIVLYYYLISFLVAFEATTSLASTVDQSDANAIDQDIFKDNLNVDVKCNRKRSKYVEVTIICTIICLSYKIFLFIYRYYKSFFFLHLNLPWQRGNCKGANFCSFEPNSPRPLHSALPTPTPALCTSFHLCRRFFILLIAEIPQKF